ncbi:MAG: hypothetical protein VW738_12465 [Pseudomonadales bacterium]|jgi:hypothetical protein
MGKDKTIGGLTGNDQKNVPKFDRVAKSFRDMAYDGQAALEKKINDAFDQMKRKQNKDTSHETEKSD